MTYNPGIQMSVMTQEILTNSIKFFQMHILYTLPVKSLGKIIFF